MSVKTSSSIAEVIPVKDNLRAAPARAEGETPDNEFAGFFLAHWAASYRLAGLMGADDPENVAQEALARLHLQFDRLRGDREAERYLRATVCNLSRSTWRRRGVADRARTRLVIVEAADAGLGLEETDALLSALRGLSARQREVIVLRYWMDLSEREIAETLKISAGSVKAHASRGIQMLRRTVVR